MSTISILLSLSTGFEDNESNANIPDFLLFMMRYIFFDNDFSPVSSKLSAKTLA